MPGLFCISYLRSPKRNANGARNPFYESMREVGPGDLIFSFMDTRILAIGIVQSYVWESPKPLKFGSAGENWEGIGWRVKVQFAEQIELTWIAVSGRRARHGHLPDSRRESPMLRLNPAIATVRQKPTSHPAVALPRR
jgi:hypothetical protein